MTSTCTACGSVGGDAASAEPCEVTGADHHYVPEGECADCTWLDDVVVDPCPACIASAERLIVAYEEMTRGR